MDHLRFRIIGTPVPKGRPKFFKVGGFVKPYTPVNTRKWEEFMRHQALRYRPLVLWDGPIAMSLTFLMPRPKSLPKKVIHHVKKPDLDNLAKSVKDAFQGIIYQSDSQICVLNVEKKYSIDEYGVQVDMHLI